MSLAKTVMDMAAAGLSAQQIAEYVAFVDGKRRAKEAEKKRAQRAACPAKSQEVLGTTRDNGGLVGTGGDEAPTPRARVVNTNLPSEDISTIPPLPPKTRNRGHRLPEGWQPDVELVSFSRSLGFSADQELRARAEFADYWRGVPGSRGCKLDWPATYRNRLRELAAKMKLKPVANVLPFVAGADPPKLSAEEQRRRAEDFDRRWKAGEFQ
jgi:hypothetical protein